jgi:hypothetical protein
MISQFANGIQWNVALRILKAKLFFSQIFAECGLYTAANVGVPANIETK